MKEQEIYQKIGELLWSIMPEEAVRIDFIGSIYPEHYSGGAEWVVANGDIHYFPLGQRPDEIEGEIINLMKQLRSTLSQEWTQYKFSYLIIWSLILNLNMFQMKIVGQCSIFEVLVILKKMR